VTEDGERSEEPPELSEPTDGELSEPPDGELPATPSHPRFRAATDEELDPQSFLVADDRAALKAVLRGGSIADDRGDATFIGGVVRRLAEVLRQTAEVYRAGTGFISNAQLRKLEFGHSVIVELEISPEEDVQLGIEGERHSPTIDAARAVGQLLAANVDELVPRALELGVETTKAYKRFIGLLAEDAVTLEWQVPDEPNIAVVSSVDARHDYAILDREGERATESIAVPGKLTMADSELRQFALTLPSELARPALLKGKHRVRGTYPEDVGERLKEEGLWDSDVMATLIVTFDVLGTTATPRDPTYVLAYAEPLIDASPTLFE
jgi:hypothetical protein